jgi:molybdopterin biosynthesis enzyme MoaB
VSDQAVPIGVVTVSDRASRGDYADRGGPAIEAALIALADAEHCPLIVTTGGTGPAPRDVTPEATAAVCDRILPGFGELMRAVPLRAVPTAILSRQLAGTRGASRWQAELLRQGFVPMFLLVPQVQLAKRLDVCGAADRALARLPAAIAREWEAITP